MTDSTSPDGKTPSDPTPTGPTFTSLKTDTSSTAASEDDVVESPSVSSSNALARFEFEPGRSTDGTKVLMVEWEDDDATRDIVGDWVISWEGKRTVLPAKDVAEGGVNRLHFLLQAGERVPATVTLTLSGTSREGNGELMTVAWRTNPLPAIFPPELGASAREAGKKGVLHTIWAKKRLQVLCKEIEAESKNNVEGVALQMAIQERDWIESNFGVVAKPVGSLALLSTQSQLLPGSPGGRADAGFSPSSPSPRSPGGGRLMDRLKGLKLDTAADGTQDQQAFGNPLSPEQSDVAVSSYGSFAALKGAAPTSQSQSQQPDHRSRQQPQPTSTSASQPPPTSPPQIQQPQRQKKITAQKPPSQIAQQQSQHSQQQHRSVGMTSLNAFAGSGHKTHVVVGSDDEREDDLFALPMSPRSPDMSKSPFSFGAKDTIRYLRGEKV